TIVRAIYIGIDPRLTGAAGLSVLAHLEDLVARGLVETAGQPSVDGLYRLAGCPFFSGCPFFPGKAFFSGKDRGSGTELAVSSMSSSKLRMREAFAPGARFLETRTQRI